MSRIDCALIRALSPAGQSSIAKRQFPVGICFLIQRRKVRTEKLSDVTSERRICHTLQPLLDRVKGLKDPVRKRSARLLVSGDQRVELLLDNGLQFSHDAEIWVDIPGFLPIPDFLTIHVHFKAAVGARG